MTQSPETSPLHLTTRADMDAAELCPIAGGTAAILSAKSPEKESDNEDGAAIIEVDERRGVVAVADGVGGHAGGAIAASLALNTLAESVLTGVHQEMSLHGSILKGFEQANESVLAMGVGAATTLVVVEIDGHNTRTYHAGDSMVLTVSNRGLIKRQTISHSPVGYAVESGMLAAEEAIHHEDRHLVSNLIGSTDMRIEIGSSLPLARFDTMLLASDGLFDNLHVAEVVEAIRIGPMREAAAKLHDLARQRMSNPQDGAPSKPDDLTFVLYRSRRRTRKRKGLT